MDKNKKEIKNNKKRYEQKNLRILPQVGTVKNIVLDSEIQAFLPGKRISATGNIYWETRRNRSDQLGKMI